MYTSGADQRHDHHSKPEHRAAIAAPEMYPLRVLLVDDGEPRSKAFLRLSLGVPDGEYVLDRVTTHQDALVAMAVGEHDVYVVPHLIGTHTGFDVLSWLKTRGTRVPVVFVTRAADHGTGVTAVSAGASCYVGEGDIDSGFLEHSLRQAVEQTEALVRLSDAGIAVDGNTSTRTLQSLRVAEQLRECTTAILDMTQRSSEFDVPADVLASFALIEDKASMLLRLADDLDNLTVLSEGVLGEGGIQFSTEAFSLRGLIPHTARSADSASGAHDPTISVQIDPDVPDSVVGDPGRLRFVIGSFAETVIAQSSAERIVVNVRLEERRLGAVTLRFTIDAVAEGGNSEGGGVRVSNDFVGIPVALFDSGALGMPDAHETVARMGGSVTVSHNQGRSVSVHFTIRLQAGEEILGLHPVLDERDGTQDAEEMILVIADDVEARHSIASSLSEAELPFVVFPSVEAWTAGRLTSDDDGVMPSSIVLECAGNTFDVCEQLNAVVSDEIPIVVVVETEKHGDTALCRERGVRGYLARPLASSDLVDVIRSLVALADSGDTTTLVTRRWLREGRPSLHVLVVDDSTTNRFLLTRMLEQRGHSTAIACDGSEAVEASQRESFDVVLMDVMMPVMDGLEATRTIIEAHTRLATRPLIIGVSAFADQSNIDDAKDAGMDGFLAKPVQPDDLFAAIEQREPEVLTLVE